MPLGNAWIGGRNWLLHAKILFVLAQHASALREKWPFAVVLTTAPRKEGDFVGEDDA
jgi:hypothetical protein